MSPLYLAVGTDNAAYFGFGSNGTGSVLYRYHGGTTVQTAPAPPPDGAGAGGGVYGIDVTASDQVFWLSAYFSGDFSLEVDVECGGAGGTARICEPTVDQPTTMIVDPSGTFWIGGISFSGGGQVRTSNNASVEFNTQSVMQLLNGPGPAVWSVLADYTQNPTQYIIAQLAISGSSINVVRSYPLPAGDAIASMTVGGDGNFWFTDNQQNAIGRMTASGALKEYPLPSANALGPPWYGQWQIATACDGAVWFSEPGPNKVGRMDSSATLTEVALPTAGASPGAVATAPGIHKCANPQVWVAEQQADALAAISY
ncbi:MAG TPA: hypothetical protein VFE17_09695 [Candidatus Baltobacteraceae bacterium]|nr:hypothetical protein [Candidatus Baltobacteraceae bacterium]